MLRPDVQILTEASPTLGHGHLARCRALAAEARSRGFHVVFCARDRYLVDLLQKAGEQICAHDAEAPIVVRDLRDGSAPEDVRREVAAGRKVLLLDESGHARCEASMVVDVFMTPARADAFSHGGNTRYLYGLPFAPLHPRFRARHAKASAGEGEDPLLIISLGGGDCLQDTASLVLALQETGFRGPARIVSSGSGETAARISDIAAGWRDTLVLPNVADMADFLVAGDLLVTKLGMTVLESFCLGVGCLLIEPSTAHVELNVMQQKAYRDWPAIEMGLNRDLDFADCALRILNCLAKRHRLSTMGRRGSELVDGLGCQRIIDELTKEA